MKIPELYLLTPLAESTHTQIMYTKIIPVFFKYQEKIVILCTLRNMNINYKIYFMHVFYKHELEIQPLIS